MVNVLKDVICKWTLEFKRGCTSFEDDPHSCYPKSATAPDILKKNVIHDIAR